MRLASLTIVLSVLVACTRETDQPPSTKPPAAEEGSARPVEQASDSGATRLVKADDGGAAPREALEDSPCRDKEKVRITLLQRGPQGQVRLEPDPEYGKATREQELDLDGHEPLDLHILWPGNAGSDGAIMQSLYVACGDGSYAAVWGPDYAISLQVREQRANGWREVVRSEQFGAPEHPTLRDIPMRFVGGTYQDAPPEK